MKRRSLLAGAGVAAAAVAAGLYRFTDLFVRHYAPTPYDDVLAALVDRPHAARLGAALTGLPDAPTLAARLRGRLQQGLAAAAQADSAAGRLLEADGWLIPESVGLLAGLAAQA